MKNLVFLPLFLLCAMAAAQNLNLIPQPVEVRAMTGNYTLSKTTAVSYNETGAKEEPFGQPVRPSVDCAHDNCHEKTPDCR